MIKRQVVILALFVMLIGGCVMRGKGKPDKSCAPMEESEVAQEPQLNIRFIYNMCNDVARMKHFYSDLVGLKEIVYDSTYGWLVYQSEGFQMMFLKAELELPVAAEFAWQPGSGKGTLDAPSWGIAVPEDRFPEVYLRLKEAGVSMLEPEPQWRQACYWGLSVLDPMGNTVEIYTEPGEKPESTEWPAE